MQNLFDILVDSIASKLSVDFVDDMKKKLIYEISLINQLGLKIKLGLFFDRGDILSKLAKLTEVYLNNLNRPNDPADENFEIDMEAYYDSMRVILFFFSSPYDDADLASSYCKNNSKNVKEILRHPRISRSSDFVVWL